MAPFNPTIQPTNDPTYTGVTRPIAIPDSINPRGVETNQIMPKGQEIGDRSAEFLGKAAAFGSEAEGTAQKGFGDLFAGIVGIGDFLGKAGVQMVRKDIEDKVYEVADKERQQYTQRLEQLKASGPVKNIMDSNASAEDENGNAVPSELSNLPDQLNVLTSARDGGKISSTDYQARLLAAAKDLRARYPGFKNEIDQEFAKVTGHNPANAYITGLVSDINRANLSKNSDQNKLLTYIMNNVGTIPNAEELAQGVMEGKYGRLDVMRRAAPVERFKADMALRKAEFEDNKLSLADKQAKGEELFNKGVDGVVSSYVQQFMTRIGLNTTQDVQSFADRVKTGDFGSKDWAQINQEWSTGMLQLRQSIYNDAKAHGLVDTLGQAKVNELTDAAMKRMEAIGQRINNHDSGGMYTSAQSVKAMGDDDQKRLLEDSKVGPDFRSIEVIKRIGGEQYLQSENLRHLTDGLSGKFASYQKAWKDGIRAQVNMETTGVPVTLNDAFDEFKDKMKTATDAEKRKMNSDMINQITDIANPKVPDKVKLNLAITAFSPGNRGFISRLNVDSVDAKGRPIQGQNAVFQKLTSPEITKEMFRLGQSNPQIWKDYTDWATETLSNELISRDIRNLAQVRNPTIRVGWDSNNNRLVSEFKPIPVPSAPGSGDAFTAINRNVDRMGIAKTNTRGQDEQTYVNAMINRINSNLSNYKNIADAAGASVPGLLLGVIAKAAGPEALQQVDNIPGDIARQIGLTALKQKANKNGVAP